MKTQILSVRKINLRLILSRVFFIFFIFLAFYPDVVYAHCPLCTGAVGATAVSAKYLGMDLSIIGLFVGAFAVSTGLWAARLIKKKYIKFQSSIIIFLSFVLTVLPLKFVSNDNLYIPIMLFGQPGTIFYRFYWIDRMVFGSIMGALLTLLAFALHNYIKNKNSNKVLFPFQGIVFTLILLFVSGAIMFFLLR